MITTMDIKSQQLEKGFFTVGSGKEMMLIMGSCRVAGYVNYLDLWNQTIGNNRFTIHSLDPFNHHFHPITNDLVDLHEAIDKMEHHEGLRNMLWSVDILIHEWYSNYGIFNTFKDQEKSIYNLCSPRIDICLPNWNDIFILFSEFYQFDKDFKESVDESYRAYDKLVPILESYVTDKAEENLKKFYGVCRKSSLPEMESIFKALMKEYRFFFTFNHISKEFSLAIFRMMNDKFLGLPITQEFMDEINVQDLFKNNYTPLTEYDVKNYGFDWKEPVVDFKMYNKIGQ